MARLSTPPTSQQFAAFQGMFDYFNRELFADELPAVILNFSRKAKTYGFFAPERWDNGKVNAHEISINPNQLKQRPPEEVASTLAHEMVHLWQHVHGNPSRAGYHNAEWAAKMEEIGLIPSDTGQPGGKKTGQQMTHYIEQGGRFQRAFAAMPPIYRLPWECVSEPEGKTTAKTKIKYSCPNGHGNVWGKADLAIICGVCGEAYLPE